MSKVFFPGYLFAGPVGPVSKHFPIIPVRLWDGRLCWLRTCYRQRMVVHQRLEHSGEFWSYSDSISEEDAS